MPCFAPFVGIDLALLVSMSEMYQQIPTDLVVPECTMLDEKSIENPQLRGLVDSTGLLWTNEWWT